MATTTAESNTDSVLVNSDDDHSDALNPLLIDVVVRNLVKYLDFNTCLNARLVCKTWEQACRSLVQSHGCVIFRDPPHSPNDPCNCENTCKSEFSSQFKQYLQDWKEQRLPYRQPSSTSSGSVSDTLLFHRFKFSSARRRKNSIQESILSCLAKHFADQVVELSFENAGAVPTFEEHAADARCWLPYADWGDTLGQFHNLQALELIGLPRESTSKCLIQLRKVLEKGILPGRIKNLKIQPRKSVEFELTRFVHNRYIDLLAKVVSLLPIEHLTLHSHLSAEELPQILRNLPHLRSLDLQRFVHVASHVQTFQETQSSIFPLDFPHLERLVISTVYLNNLEELNRYVPNLRSLKFKYQPLMYYDEEGNSGCAGVRADFALITIEHPMSNCKIEEVEWTVDPASEILNLYEIGLSVICDLTLFGISMFFPNVKRLKAFVSSADDMRMIFSRYGNLEELTIVEESMYSPEDEDFVRNDGGIRALTNLRVLRLENDNSLLTPESFRNGFLCLPNLHSLQIRHAPALHRFTVYAQKDRWSSSLVNVLVSKD